MLLEPDHPDAPTSTASGTLWPLVAGCVALAALSLLLPSTPTYDPWAWITWGREVAHLDLVTTGGPSWKPLPALFTTVFSLFGGAAPDLWLVVARAGGLLGLVFAFLVARRLGGPAAGVAAVFALVIAPWLFKNSALGNSEGLMAACVLGAVDRHLAGARRVAFALGLAAALLRPEAWAFFGLYGLWLVWRDRKAIWLVGAGFLSLPVLWFIPELWGSGDLNRASERAQNPNPNSPAFAEHPVAEVLRNAGDMVTWPVIVGLAVVLVAVLARRPVTAGRVGPVLVLSLIAVAWLAIVAFMTRNGFSGNQRYLVMPVTLAVVVGAVGAGWLVTELRLARPALLAPVALALAVAFTAPYWGGARGMVANLGYQAQLRTDLTRVVRDAGGVDRVKACGQAATGAFLVPAVAWELGVHANSVTLRPGRPAVVFRVSTVPGSNPVPPLRTLGPGRIDVLAQRGHWRVLGACA